MSAKIHITNKAASSLTSTSLVDGHIHLICVLLVTHAEDDVLSTF